MYNSKHMESILFILRLHCHQSFIRTKSLSCFNVVFEFVSHYILLQVKNNETLFRDQQVNYITM